MTVSLLFNEDWIYIKQSGDLKTMRSLLFF
jgi:hypothetical protein